MEVMALKRPRLDGWNSWNGDGWEGGWRDGWMNHGVDLILGPQSTVLTMVEAWVALFGWIHGMEVVFVLKRSLAALSGHLCWLQRIHDEIFTASLGTQKVFALLHSLT